MKVFLFFAAVLSVSLFSCKKKDPGPKRKESPKAIIQQADARVLATDTIAISQM